MKIKKVIVFDYGNFLVSSPFLPSSIFILPPFSPVSVPLRGKKIETLLEISFIQHSHVSVPLRGKKIETTGVFQRSYTSGFRPLAG